MFPWLCYLIRYLNYENYVKTTKKLYTCMNQLRGLSTSGVKLYSPKRKTKLHAMQFINFQWYLFFYFCDAVDTIRSFKKISNLFDGQKSRANVRTT